MNRIDDRGDALRQRVEVGARDHDLALRPGALGQSLHQRLAIVLDARGLFAKQTGDLAQHVDERRPAIAGGFGKIGPAPKRLGGGREKHGQRPAALLAQHVQRRHVDLVDVGALFAIDFDVDEELVHHTRHGLVLETFVRHDVTPVAGRIADREQDRPVAALRLCQRLRSPGPPVDGIELVLQKVWAAFPRQPIFRVRLDGGHRGLSR